MFNHATKNLESYIPTSLSSKPVWKQEEPILLHSYYGDRKHRQNDGILLAPDQVCLEQARKIIAMHYWWYKLPSLFLGITRSGTPTMCKRS